jgi:hypothetical protein
MSFILYSCGADPRRAVDFGGGGIETLAKTNEVENETARSTLHN